jgi:outer membrane lipoprotein-sorting protein
MTGARKAISILLMVLLAGCAEKDAPTADTEPRAALRGAVARTLEANSFHVDATIVIAGKEETAEIDYAAPDRLRFVVNSEYDQRSELSSSVRVLTRPAKS